MKKIVTVLSWLVLGVILIYVLTALPMLGGYRPIVVLSGSMEPAYPVGSLTYYRACPFEQIKVGDAITFQAEDSFVTHRVTEKQELSRTFTTKGDNNETEDVNPVLETDVVGKTVKLDIPYLGYFVTIGRNPVLILLMGVILLLSYGLDVLEKKQRRSHETENYK